MLDNSEPPFYPSSPEVEPTEDLPRDPKFGDSYLDKFPMLDE